MIKKKVAKKKIILTKRQIAEIKAQKDFITSLKTIIKEYSKLYKNHFAGTYLSHKDITDTTISLEQIIDVIKKDMQD